MIRSSGGKNLYPAENENAGRWAGGRGADKLSVRRAISAAFEAAEPRSRVLEC